MAGEASEAKADVTQLAPKLEVKHIFGLKSTVNGAIHYLDENMLVYAAGANVLIYSHESRQQRFLHYSTPSDLIQRPEICALTVATNPREKSQKFVAVAERGDPARYVISASCCLSPSFSLQLGSFFVPVCSVQSGEGYNHSLHFPNPRPGTCDKASPCS